VAAVKRAAFRSSTRSVAFSGYTWDANANRYRDSLGRFVDERKIRNELDAALARVGERMNAVSAELQGGRISLEAWHAEMRLAVKNTHVMSAALAKGGWGQLTQRDYGRIGVAVRKQYDYLNGFANEVSLGRQLLNGRFLVRAKMYAQAARMLFERIREAEMIAAGMNEERNVLGIADHCFDCVAMTALGWVLVGTLIPIGERQCGPNCRCRKAYRYNPDVDPDAEEP
jgi:hypothetical protein